MLNLEKLDQQAMSTAQEHIELATKEIVDKWKVLPKYKCNAHMSLLQATQLVGLNVYFIIHIIIILHLLYYFI